MNKLILVLLLALVLLSFAPRSGAIYFATTSFGSAEGNWYCEEGVEQLSPVLNCYWRRTPVPCEQAPNNIACQLIQDDQEED